MTLPARPTTWPEFAKDLGAELQRLRLGAGMTQEALAFEAGLTRTHYQQIERGQWRKDTPANPSIKILVRLAQALGVEVGDLLPSASRIAWDEE